MAFRLLAVCAPGKTLVSGPPAVCVRGYTHRERNSRGPGFAWRSLRGEYTGPVPHYLAMDDLPGDEAGCIVAVETPVRNVRRVGTVMLGQAEANWTQRSNLPALLEADNRRRREQGRTRLWPAERLRRLKRTPGRARFEG